MNVENPDRTADYRTIEQAIGWLQANAAHQPGLTELAAAMGYHPHHLQRLFSRWAGISPKRFLQIVTTNLAKDQLRRGQSVLAAAYEVGLSGPGRLHDHLVTLDAVSPGEYKSGGAGVTIQYGMIETPFGQALIGFTSRGICHLSFLKDEQTVDPVAQFRREWPAAQLQASDEQAADLANQIFSSNGSTTTPLHLWVKGTNFQLQVWRALLSVPFGSVQSYQSLADAIGRPTAARAVGAAVGCNAIAYLIPCHRILRKSGAVHHYRWGGGRKRAMLVWEAAKSDT